MKSTWVCLALAVPLFAVGQATAQDEERPRRDGEMRQRMIEEFDADGDGQLNDEERQTARETMRERRGDRPGRGGQARGGEDRGGQGRGGEGRGRGQADRPAPSRDEEVARPRGPRGPEGPRPEGRGPGGRGPGGWGGQGPNRIFDRFDENGDGQLSRDEFAKFSDWTREIRERFAGEGQRGRGPRGEGAGGPGRGRPRGDRPPRPQRPDAESAPAVEASPADESSA